MEALPEHPPPPTGKYLMYIITMENQIEGKTWEHHFNLMVIVLGDDKTEQNKSVATTILQSFMNVIYRS